MRLPTRWLASPVLTLLFSDPLPGAARAAPSEADSAYASYRIPDHRFWQLTADLSGSGSRQKHTGTNALENVQAQLSGRFAARALWGIDSDPTALSLAFAADFLGNRHDSQNYEERTFLETVETASKQVQENLNERLDLFGTLRRYPWGPPVGITLETRHLFTLDQHFSSATQISRFQTSTSEYLASNGEGGWLYQGSIAGGVGFGRVRDVTPVYQAQVLEDRLRRSGALSRALSRGARERVAALLTTESDVGFAHQRPNKYFWEALERVLREDGALEGGSLDAYSAHRVLEPIVPTGSVFRRRGYFVGPAVTLSTTRSHLSHEAMFSEVHYLADTLLASYDASLDTLTNDRSDVVRTSFLAEYHQPFGLRWQLDASHRAQVAEAGEFVTATTVLSATYMVSDRWIGGVSGLHALRTTGHGSALSVDVWTVQLSAEIHYFVEDSWTLSVRARGSQSNSPDLFSRFGSIELGITRLFSGLFELPGIVSAMRPAPPAP